MILGQRATARELLANPFLVEEEQDRQSQRGKLPACLPLILYISEGDKVDDRPKRRDRGSSG